MFSPKEKARNQMKVRLVSKQQVSIGSATSSEPDGAAQQAAASSSRRELPVSDRCAPQTKPD